MDIAYFISDLLGQQGDVSVPNLGHFAQVRVPAFYDNRSKQFLPPHYSVQFDPKVTNDDDALAEHISAIKKISASSAKYFIEKFIGNLKTQAIGERVELPNLGSFSSDGSQLTFNPIKNSEDPAFFAFPAVDIYRIGDTPKKQSIINERVVETPVVNNLVATPVIEQEPVVRQTVYPPQTVAESDEDAYANESRGIATWMIVACAVAVLLIVLGGLYKFKPELFQQFSNNNNQPATETHADPIIKKDTNAVVIEKPVKQDSVAKKDTMAIVADHSEKPVTNDVVKEKTPVVTPPVTAVTTPVTAPPVASTQVSADMPDVITKGTWVIYSQVFPTKHGADMRVKELKNKGFEQARLATDKVGPGGNYKVILGAFKNFTEAADAKKELLATGKLTSEDLSVEKY